MYTAVAVLGPNIRISKTEVLFLSNMGVSGEASELQMG
jgi:hypothetical protein